MTSSVAPYEQLVKQVEALKAENSHLRQELRDNSSHLSKLETETSGMKVGWGVRWKTWAWVTGTNTRVLDPRDGQAGASHRGVSSSGTAQGSGHTNWHFVLPPPPGSPEALTGQVGAGGPSAGVFRAD